MSLAQSPVSVVCTGRVSSVMSKGWWCFDRGDPDHGPNRLDRMTQPLHVLSISRLLESSKHSLSFFLSQLVSCDAVAVSVGCAERQRAAWFTRWWPPSQYRSCVISLQKLLQRDNATSIMGANHSCCVLRILTHSTHTSAVRQLAENAVVGVVPTLGGVEEA